MVFGRGIKDKDDGTGRICGAVNGFQGCRLKLMVSGIVDNFESATTATADTFLLMIGRGRVKEDDSLVYRCTHDCSGDGGSGAGGLGLPLENRQKEAGLAGKGRTDNDNGVIWIAGTTSLLQQPGLLIPQDPNQDYMQSETL